jgi:hypothetical protein
MESMLVPSWQAQKHDDGLRLAGPSLLRRRGSAEARAEDGGVGDASEEAEIFIFRKLRTPYVSAMVPHNSVAGNPSD